MLESDIITMAIVSGIVMLLLILFWKEFKLLAFDKDYAATLGYPTTALNFILTTLIVASIVIGLQAVGVVLMSAIIIAPSIAARQWTDRLGLMVFLAGAIGAVSGVIGAFLSSNVTKLPTGPTIVLAASAIVLISMLFSPGRGIISEQIRLASQRKSLQGKKILYQLNLLAKSHDSPFYAHDISSLAAINKADIKPILGSLEKEGFVACSSGKWGLTPKGLAESKKFTGEKE